MKDKLVLGIPLLRWIILFSFVFLVWIAFPVIKAIGHLSFVAGIIWMGTYLAIANKFAPIPEKVE